MAYLTRQAYRDAWEKAETEDPPVPLNVDIELASACNAKCTFCLYGDRDWTKSMEELDWDRKPKRRFMLYAMAIQLISEAAMIGVPALKFNFRGESTLHPEFSNIIEVAKTMKAARLCPEHERMGMHSCSVETRPAFHDLLINTNGNCPDSSISGLMGCTKVMVSLDSMDPSIYPKVRVGLSLDRAKRLITLLCLREHPNLWIRRVICKDNQDEDFIGAVKREWGDAVKASQHYAFDRNHYQNQSVHQEDITEWPRQYCGYPSQRVVVESNGRMVPCCVAWEGELAGGIYPKLSLYEYWKSEWRKRLVSELRQDIFNNKKCQNCTTYMAYRRPERKFVNDVEAK